VRSGSIEAGLAGLALTLGLAAAASAQDPGFFDQASSYFKAETIEGVSKHAEAPAEAPATVTIVSREEIERYGFRTVSDVLNFASLGNSVAWDRRYDLAGSRGLFFFEDFNTRLLLMLNGHPVNEPWASFGGLGREMLVPMDLVERVEIVYGPSSLLYGGYSLYGIVNVVTRTGGSMSGSRARLSYGSWRTWEGVASYGRSGVTGGDEGGGAEWSVLAAAGMSGTTGESLDLPTFAVDYKTSYDGGQIWGGPQSGTDFERAPFAFLLARRGGLSLMGRAGYRRRGAPFAPYGAVYGSRDQSLRDQKLFGELRYEREVGSGTTLTLRLFHDRYAYDERDPYAELLPGAAEPGYDFFLATNDRDTGGEVRLTRRQGTHYLTVGGEYRYRDLGLDSRSAYRSGSTVPGTDASAEATGHFGVAYLQEEWRPRDALSFIAGASVADTEPGGTKAQPRLAAIVKPRRGLSLKALYARGFRPPTIYEASYGDFLTKIPNPALGSEQIASAELSIIWEPTRRTSIQAYGFRSRLEGLIQGVEIGAPGDVQGGVTAPSGDPADLVGQLQYQSTGDVRSSGAGVSVRLRSARLLAHANVTYARGLRAVGGAPEAALPGASRWLACGGVSYRLGSWTGSIAARYVGPQPLDPARGGGTAGDFAEANLRLAYRTRAVYPVVFTLDVLNALGGDGELAASSVYAPSRLRIEGPRILVGAEIRF
jgi:outer membrane receptor for ferrienterochelin and colicins